LKYFKKLIVIVWDISGGNNLNIFNELLYNKLIIY